MSYINRNKLLFDFVSFLQDYTNFRYIFGTILIVVGLIGLTFVIIYFNIEKKIYIIHKGFDDDYGLIDLDFNDKKIFDINQVVYTNLCSTGDNNNTLLKAEKKNIYNFYEKNCSKKYISFLSVSLFPFIVYAGYCIGETGKKVTYYHYNHVKQKVIKIPQGSNITNQLIADGELFIGNKERTICISISHSIDKEIVKNEFNGTSIFFYKSEIIGTESIKNRKDIEKIAEQVRKIISEVPKKTHLLLSCPAELCLAIGQKLKSPGLPEVNVYNYNAKKVKKWNWSIRLDNKF
ncbi:MAG: SAVED domain-containing protein [Bacilli bacterium]